MKVVKRPIEVEAHQVRIPYKGIIDLGDKAPGWLVKALWDLSCGVHIPDTCILKKDGTYVVRTLEGDMEISDGDYIIKGIQGELYPCKPDIFGASYMSSESTIDETPDPKDTRPMPDRKTLDISEVKGARENIKDIKVFGDGDTFLLLCKASSDREGWMKSTKVCNLHNGCLVQVTTQQHSPDGSYAVAEALQFVPDVNIDTTVDPRRLVYIGNLK